MLKKEYEILAPFIRQPWKRFTCSEIMKSSRKRSKSYVHSTLKKYVKDGVLCEEKAGNVVLYSPVLSSMKAQACIGFSAEHIAQGKKHIPFSAIGKITKKIPTAFYILIITGSYAKGRQTPDSDCDLVIITDDTVETKKVHAALQFRCETSIPPIHLYVFRKSEFLEMLINKEANYGKAAAIDNLILSGGPEYFRIMNEAIENGFTDKNLS